MRLTYRFLLSTITFTPALFYGRRNSEKFSVKTGVVAVLGVAAVSPAVEVVEAFQPFLHCVAPLRILLGLH